MLKRIAAKIAMLHPLMERPDYGSKESSAKEDEDEEDSDDEEED